MWLSPPHQTPRQVGAALTEPGDQVLAPALDVTDEDQAGEAVARAMDGPSWQRTFTLCPTT
jgi:hypothetical protein